MPNTAPSAPVLYSFPTNAKLLDGLATFILKAQKESIDKKGRFSVALSGGSLPKQLSALVNHPGVKWDKWYACTLPLLAFRISTSLSFRGTPPLKTPCTAIGDRRKPCH